MSRELQDKAERIMRELKDALEPLKEEIQTLKGQDQGRNKRI